MTQQRMYLYLESSHKPNANMEFVDICSNTECAKRGDMLCPKNLKIGDVLINTLKDFRPYFREMQTRPGYSAVTLRCLENTSKSDSNGHIFPKVYPNYGVFLIEKYPDTYGKFSTMIAERSCMECAEK